ncbi:hypothetical protein KR038_008029 [Drosophila bunnanda]|nr:hypothetical protein KR038_008029 [Drosophila bunnanda]
MQKEDQTPYSKQSPAETQKILGNIANIRKRKSLKTNMFPMKKNNAPKFHVSGPQLSQHEIDKVIKDVIANVHQDFVDDGAGEEALHRLLHTWYSKMMARRSPLEIPSSNGPQSWKDEDENSAAGPSSFSAVPFPVKKEGNKEPVAPKEDDIEKESPNDEPLTTGI